MKIYFSTLFYFFILSFIGFSANALLAEEIQYLTQTINILNPQNTLQETFLPFVLVLSALVINIAILSYHFFYRKKQRNKITTLKKQVSQLKKFAYFNPVSHLKNRISFQQDIPFYQKPVCLLVNITRFKQINDFYGTEAGDYILKKFGIFLEAIRKKFFSNSALYHLDSDDFAIVYDDALVNKSKLEKEIVDTLFAIGEKKKYYYNEIEIHIDFSIGISRGEKLLERADMVLKYIRKHTRLPYLEFDEALNLQSTIETNLQTVHLINHALKKNHVLPFFQPIIDNKTGNIYKYECLVRIKSDTKEYSLPENFFEAVEGTNYYREVTIVMLKKSIEYFRQNNFLFSVNISVSDILDEQINSLIEKILSQNPQVAKRLTFEILENEPILDYKTVNNFIEKFKTLGCAFAIDDFGSGYANLNHLIKLKIDYIKIDGSLIQNLDKDQNAKIIVRTIVDFAFLAKIKTIAEYVHSQEIYHLVKELNVDFSQGFYLGKPEQSLSTF